MKFEGEDRERPWDDVTIFVGMSTMNGCLAAAWFLAESALTYALTMIVSACCMYVLVPLLRADTARIRRQNEQMKQEIARVDAQIERLKREAGEDK